MVSEEDLKCEDDKIWPFENITNLHHFASKKKEKEITHFYSCKETFIRAN